MSTRIDAFGTQLQMGDGAPTEVFTAVAGLSDIDGPGVSRGFHDGTAHDTTGASRQKIPAGIGDGGQVSIEGFYDPAATIHKDFITAAKAGTVKNWKVVDVDTGASETTFSGFVTDFRRRAPVDGLLGFSATIELDVLPTFPA